MISNDVLNCWEKGEALATNTRNGSRQILASTRLFQRRNTTWLILYDDEPQIRRLFRGRF
eukprot:CAMPEP_0113499306 /NCGR_PEP_ID=MMETSP0014_2-20120614/31674_1 /TAXON_ID=2857 /ORGANISM="Nitzschia sp." /LENGTH=59 /DNA_ID=CAMNT_0000393465 /DNA_START=348 /DNA_END=527 /DNA_ORIENTATION=+ /assembly_acc=CAM_ASM_000159